MTSDRASRDPVHAGSPEEKLEQIVAEHRRELEEQAARFEAAMRDLERRETLLRDMRASVDRLLRLGSTDLSAREVELQELGRDLLDREARLGTEEAELSRRRSELGAVELRREALEQRERALAARESELEAREARAVDQREDGAQEAERGDGDFSVELLFVPAPRPRAIGTGASRLRSGASSAYRLVEVAPRPLAAGSELELDDETWVVSRVGASPLPGDARRCAYLESSSVSGGSS